MTPIAWLIIAAIVLPLAYFAWVLITLDRQGALAVQTNLGSGLGRAGNAEVRRTSLLLGVSKRMTPRSYESKLDHWLAMAGRPQSMPLEKLIISKPIAALA